jgi:hypothetical protein
MYETTHTKANKVHWLLTVVLGTVVPNTATTAD